MATTPELKEWNLTATWELNHEKGIAKFSIRNGDNMVASARYVQGFYVDNNGKLIPHEELQHLLWLLEKLRID